MAGFSGPAIVNVDLKLVIDPVDDVCSGGKSIMTDLAGANDGTVYSGKSVKFDGNNDYIACGSDTSIDMAIGDSYSITCWINKRGSNSGNYAQILDNYASIRNWAVGNWINTDQLFFEWRRADNAAWTATQLTLNLAQDEWNFLAITVTSGGSGGTKTIVTRLFNSNGTPSTTTKTTTDDWSDSGTGNFNIGRSQSNGTYFNGEVSDVRVYKKVLSADEIDLIYNKPNIVLPPDVVSSDLVGWWPLIEGSGTTALDNSSNSNNGTLTNDPMWVSQSASIPQTATGFEYSSSLVLNPNKGWFDFDGKTYISTAANLSDLTNTTAISISLWAKNNNAAISSDETMMARYEGTSNQRVWYLRLNTDEDFYTAFANDSGAAQYDTSGPVSNVNEWHMYTATFNSGDVLLYVDGTVVSSTQSGTDIDSLETSHTEEVTIGGLSSAGSWQGQIGIPMIYTKVLSPIEILQNYNAMKSRFT
jgi:hypothetical protein